MITIPKGTKDVLPSQSYKWRFIENQAKSVADAFCYKEIRTPVFEHTPGPKIIRSPDFLFI